MGLNINNKGGDEFEIMPEDTHIAICYGVIDLGTQRGEFKGKEKIQGKFMLMFETPNQTIEYEGEEKPMVISKEYTKSTGEKSNFYKDLTSWKGRTPTPLEIEGFDARKLAGVPCQIQVIHKTSQKGNKYPYINSIIKMPQGMPMPVGTYDTIVYELTEGYIPESIPEWIQNKIKESMEWKGEIPFEGAEPSVEGAPEEITDVEPF